MRFSILLLALLPLFAQAQSPTKSELSPCGTPPGLSPWLLEYFARPGEYPTRNDDTLKAAVQVHWVGRNDGSARFSPNGLLDAFCRLNQDFASTGIRFYFKNDWNKIDSTAWHNHTTTPQGIAMMLANNVPGALNAYFVSNPAGNCGYNLPYAGVAIGHGCAGPNDHTWTHEVGHALSLPHPFIGWEGKSYTFSTPTPTSLTYDYTHFHDTLDTQIGKLDTALVEYLSGSNCTIAADRICDTPPDYLSNRWNCDGQNKSLVQQKDPNGATFYSDGTLFMSYANDECQNRFSPQQIAAMRANLLSEKADWLTNKIPPPAIVGIPTLLEPAASGPALGTVLRWSSVPNASQYVVQLTRIANFSAVEKEYVTSDTSLVLGQLVANKTYNWRVRPFNEWQTCTSLSPGSKFLTLTPSSTVEPDAEGWRYYPTPLSAGDALQLELPPSWGDAPVQIALFDAVGRQCFEQHFSPKNSRCEVLLPPVADAAGVYFLSVRGRNGAKSGVLIR